MDNYEQLPENLLESCKPRKTEHGKLDRDLTVSCGRAGSETYFLTNVFKDGSLLGFWSHSPWGYCKDQEKGWVVFNKELEMISYCETVSQGRSAGEDWRTWRKEQTKLHGKSKRITDGTENIWKIAE